MKKFITLALATLLMLGALGAAPAPEATPSMAETTVETPSPKYTPTPSPSPLPEMLAVWEGSFRFIEPESMKAVLQISRAEESMSFEIWEGDTALAQGTVRAGKDRGILLRGREPAGGSFSAVLEPVADTLNYTLTVRLAAEDGPLSRERCFRLRRTDNPENLAPFLGDFRAAGDDNPAPADLSVREDGSFSLKIERLTEFRGWVDFLRPDGAMLSARDPSGEPISFEYIVRDGEYRLRVTDSAWMLLPAGETFRFAAAGEESKETPSPAPAPSSAVPRGYEGFVGRYVSSRPGPAELEIRQDGSFWLDVRALGEIEGVVSSAEEGFVVLAGRDARETDVTLEFGNKFDRYELRDGEGSQGLLPGGGVYDFERERTAVPSPVPTEEPSPEPEGETQSNTPQPETEPTEGSAGEETPMDEETTAGPPGWLIVCAIFCIGAAGVWFFIRSKTEQP